MKEFKSGVSSWYFQKSVESKRERVREEKRERERDDRCKDRQT